MKYIITFILSIGVYVLACAQPFYKTPTGDRFHIKLCRMVKNTSTKINTVEAVNNLGLTACKICKPVILQNNSIQNRSTNKSTQPTSGSGNTQQCKGKTKAGNRCKHKTSIANGYCYQHTSQSQ